MTPRPDSSRQAGALSPATTRLISTSDGVNLEYLVTGTGDPITVFAHGLGGDIPQTRPLGSGVQGRRVFFHLRGHGRSTVPDGAWAYPELAHDLRTVSDKVGATRAVGASLGAGALCRLLAEAPDRYERLVFFLPAVLDQPRTGPARARIADLARAAASGDPELATATLRTEIPAEYQDTPEAQGYLRHRAEALLQEGVAKSLLTLPAAVAIPAELGGAAALERVTAPALVLGCRDDPLHPVEVAERLAAALPDATLHVYDEPGVLWNQRADLRDRVSAFLNR